MECFTDQFCLMNAVQDSVTQATLFVDYLGINLFGADWHAVTPIVEERIDTLLRIVSRVVPVEPDQCINMAPEAVRHV